MYHLLNATTSILVLVDYQAKLMPAIAHHDRVVAEAVYLGHVAQQLGVTIIGTEQNPAGLGHNVPEVVRLCDHMVHKTHFNACDDGLLHTIGNLHKPAKQVVIAGCETHVCLLQTAMGLIKEGYEVFVVESACGSRSLNDKQLGIHRLQQAGAVIVSPEMVVFEWLNDCKNPRFKGVLELIKQRSLI